MGAKIKTINPATEQVMAEYDLLTADQAVRAVKDARKAFAEWKRKDISERARMVWKLNGVIDKRKRETAELITREMGKPVAQSIAELDKCKVLVDYYTQNAESFLKEEYVKTDNIKSYVRFDPLGVILGIMPWNFPVWQVLRFSIPAMIAGNTVLLKHSSIVAGTAIEIERMFRQAGLPFGIFQNLTINSDVVRDVINSDINGVSVTGSVATGSIIGEQAGSGLKKIVLELGGSDPFVVLDDADIDSVCEGAKQARNLNTGQSCIAAKRFIVTRKIARDFTEKLVELTKNLKVGNPMNPETEIGPLVRDEQRQQLERQVNESVRMGAKVLTGGTRPKSIGFYYQPAVLADVTNNMPVIKEETFGPVSPIIVVKDEREAVQEANNTEYGLGASIWSRNVERAEKLAREIDAGVVAINKTVRSDPRLPFGGVKKSGLGRELSRYGILEFVNIKSVFVK